MALAILLFFLGVMLITLDVFFPSFGVLSISAAAVLITAIVFAFKESMLAGFLFLAVTIVAVPMILRFAFKALPHTAVGKRVVLARPPSRLEPAEPAAASRLGRTGRTLSELRPSGAVEFDGERLDVVTGGEWVARGRLVRIVREEGNRITVEAVDAGEASPDRKKPRWA